ncbi:IPT/TIG domain-containing protein [Nocardia gipuzkoensis]|uniref:IPT/TIG domain-containing protein n=1 Tax=Nocardia gipuzkoensis TaxID=2749991 RepID=UPI003EE09B97
MSDFSQPPLELLQSNLQKGYVGLHIEQGVPILDRDLNLMHDLLAAGLRRLFARYIGDGIAAGGDGFAVQALPSGQNRQDFRIAAAEGGPGSLLAGGIEVSIAQPIRYGQQAGIPALTTPTAAQVNPREDKVYLDVFLRDVDVTTDPDLSNAVDVGMQTAIRLAPSWTVRVAEGAPIPKPPLGHNFSALAKLSRPRGVDTIESSMITDLRRRGLDLSGLLHRLAQLEKMLILPAFATPAFSPSRGFIGQLITINGTNFIVGGSDVTVLFGDRPARLAVEPKPNQLMVRVPADLVPTGTPFVDVPITVRHDGGSVVSDETFHAVLKVPAPAFGTSPNPGNGTVGQRIALNGRDFNWPPVTVRFKIEGGTPFDGTDLTVTDTRIDVTVPTGLAPAGQFRETRITVITAGGEIISPQTLRVFGGQGIA